MQSTHKKFRMWSRWFGVIEGKGSKGPEKGVQCGWEGGLQMFYFVIFHAFFLKFLKTKSKLT